VGVGEVLAYAARRKRWAKLKKVARPEAGHVSDHVK